MIFNIPNPDLFRANIRKHIAALLTLDLDKDMQIYGNVEKGVYNFAIKESTDKNIVKKWDNPSFVNLYMDRLRSVYMNLKNPELADRIRSGEVLANNVAFMSHFEMNPARWQESLQRKMMRDASKMNTNVQASTDMYTCKRCRSKKTTYYEVATRSADEQMTIFITCLDCGKNWKQ